MGDDSLFVCYGTSGQAPPQEAPSSTSSLESFEDQLQFVQQGASSNGTPSNGASTDQLQNQEPFAGQHLQEVGFPAADIMTAGASPSAVSPSMSPSCSCEIGCCFPRAIWAYGCSNSMCCLGAKKVVMGGSGLWSSAMASTAALHHGIFPTILMGTL